MSERTIKILAFETSCDDTSVAVLQATAPDQMPRLLSLSVQSQWEVHEKFGGVVPELASRAHLENILPCLRKALSDSGLALSEIDIFAATQRPGLIGCLLIGHTAAKALACAMNKPLISCQHIEGHLMSVFLEHKIAFPVLSLVASGGHTSLYRLADMDTFHLLGQTLDDAAGEAFDKGAKLLNLPLPGGPAIDAISKGGDPSRYPLGRVSVEGLNFSFSGLKSEFARIVQREGTKIHVPDAAASLQKAIVDHIIAKLRRAAREESLSSVAIVGGVARNSEIRRQLNELKEKGEIEEWYAPRPELCTDNAAMIGALAYRKFLRNEWGTLSDDVSGTSRPSRRKKS